MRTARFYFLIIVLFSCYACAATQIALEKKDLKVETKMSDTIFLDIESQVERTIFVDMRNTSDKDIDIKSQLINKLQEQGYVVKATPKEAFYILQGNILYVGKGDPSALRESLYAGYGGALAGAVGGALGGGAARGAKGAAYGAGIGGLVGGIAEVVAGSLVKDVTYSIVTDLMISESKQKRKRYQTRVLSTANKVNLKFEEAVIPLVQGLTKSIAGIF